MREECAKNFKQIVVDDNKKQMKEIQTITQ
jgi:hypothetical protein